MKITLYFILFVVVMYFFVHRWLVKVFARKWFLRRWWDDIQIMKASGRETEAKKSALLLITFDMDRNLKYIVRGFLTK